MKKVMIMILSIYLVLGAYGQANPSAKVVEVTNYKEVLSQIEYPKESKEKGIEGKVIVSLTIDEKGNLISHEFLAFPCGDLKEAVKEMLPKLNFTPAMNAHGDAVVSKITMPINFKLTI